MIIYKVYLILYKVYLPVTSKGPQEFVLVTFQNFVLVTFQSYTYYIYTCIYAHARTHARTHARKHALTRTHACTHARTHIHIHHTRNNKTATKPQYNAIQYNLIVPVQAMPYSV